MTPQPEPRGAAPTSFSIRARHKLRRQLLAERIFFLAVIALLAFMMVRRGRALTAYQITVNGKPVALVSQRSTAEKLLRELRGSTPAARFRETTAVVEVNPRAPAVLTEQAARQALTRAVNVVVPAYVVLVNGRVAAALRSREQAQGVLDRLRATYAGPKQKSYFKERVSVEQAEVQRTRLLSAGEAFKALAGQTASGAGQVWRVSAGDSAWRIASAHNLTVEQLAALNPGVDIDRLQDGQALRVAGGKPALTVVTVEERTELKTIPHVTQVRTAPELPKGQRRVLAQGQDGQKTVRYRTIAENGRPVKREVLSETTLRAPKTERVSVGTGA